MKLPQVPVSAGVDLVEALRLRRSTREYDLSREIPPDALSALLWAALGINGPEDKRTAPSAFGGNQVEAYVASAAGVARYDAAAHQLVGVGTADIRSGLASDDWVNTAPVAILLTGRTDKFPDFATAALVTELLHATAGCITENIHLMAAALGLGVCMVGHMNAGHIRQALQLTRVEVPLYVIPVGYLR